MSDKCPKCGAGKSYYKTKNVNTGIRGKSLDYTKEYDCCTKCGYKSKIRPAAQKEYWSPPPLQKQIEKVEAKVETPVIEVISTVEQLSVTTEKVRFNFEYGDLSLTGEMGKERFMNLFKGLIN